MDLLYLFKILLMFALLRFFKWVLKYFYTLWVYRNVDGPRYLPFIGNFLQLNCTKSELYKQYQSIFTKYTTGRFLLYWVGTHPIIVFNKEDDLDVIFNDANFMDKSFDYELMHPWLSTGLLTAGGNKWFTRRKLITPSFHFDILKDFLAVINEQSEIFIGILKRANKSEKIALKPYLSACSLDIICETAMGVNVNAQGEENNYVKAVNRMCELLLDRMRIPYLWPDLIFKQSENYKGQKETLAILHGFTKKIINERSEGFSGLSGVDKKRVAFLDTLLDARLKNPDSIDLDGIQEEVDTFMFEGHDTTTSALDWACFAIGTHPEVQKKLHDEIDAVFGDSDRSISQDDLNKMPYLECAIKESLRLYPPVSFIARTVKEETTLWGQKILANTTITIAIHNIHRDARHYPEPEKFRPERFSAESSNETKRPFQFIPFSAGRRNCIGQRFALMELKIMLTNILRNFKLECDQTLQELKPYSYLILRSEVPITMKLTQRKK